MPNFVSPNVLVVQMGARRDYGYATIMHAHGALAGLYTDTAWPEGAPLSKRIVGRMSSHLETAVCRRTVVGISPQQLRSTTFPNLVGNVSRALRFQSQTCCRFEDRVLGMFAKRWGLRGANIVLNTMGNGGPSFLRWAKRQGAKIATDIIITPLAAEIVEKEREIWPGWEVEFDPPAALRSACRHIEELSEISDLLLCPSQTVVDGLSTVRGFDPSKIAMVPYAIDIDMPQPGQPRPKRVLFAGQPGLRKGVPYLGLAATLLKQRDPNIVFVVAGGVTDRVRARPECRDLDFLGHIGQAAMSAELSMTDVFCLPSLAEGSAVAVLEALAHGVPCVVTPSTGTSITDGIEGFIVPERDADALADAILRIITDRELRARMGTAALQLAHKHRRQQVGTSLYEALGALVAGEKTMAA